MQMAKHVALIWWKGPFRDPLFADKMKEFIRREPICSFLLGLRDTWNSRDFTMRSIISRVLDSARLKGATSFSRNHRNGIGGCNTTDHPGSVSRT